jgi:hypothetical protein
MVEIQLKRLANGILAGQRCKVRERAGKTLGLAGFEPAASCTRGRRSTKLSHSPNYSRTYFAYSGCSGKAE